MPRGVTSLMAPPGLPVVGYPATGASGAKGVCHGIVAYPLNTPLASRPLGTFRGGGGAWAPNAPWIWKCLVEQDTALFYVHMSQFNVHLPITIPLSLAASSRDPFTIRIASDTGWGSEIRKCLWTVWAYTCGKKIGGESHAPGLPVYQLSIDTTFVGYISFICPG